MTDSLASGTKLRVVVVGGVAGGASAAARLRRLDETASIVVFERGPYASFANCGLPYYLGGEIASRDRLVVAGDTQLKGWLNLDVRTQCEVVAINRQDKTVTAREMESGREYTEPYDYLILAPGATPIRPPAMLEKVGTDHPRVLSMRDIPDIDRIKAVVDGGARSAIVIGGGFIGLEAAEQLVHRKVKVSLVEMLTQVMPPFDPEIVTPLHQALTTAGVDLRLGKGVVGLAPLPGDRVEVTLDGGDQLQADLVVLAIGVRPESTLAQQAGLECNERGAIKVDSHLRTNDPSIYAAGDAIEVDDPILGGKTQIPLAGPANRQGRLIADHIVASTGGQADSVLTYRGTQGTSVVRVFDVVAGMTGASEKALIKAGKRLHADIEVVHVHPFNHAGYFPGAKRMALKLLFERPSGRVLGAQAVGGEGVDKRIDVLAMAIQMKATVFDLEQAELAYAPPFGSAKDPVNLAAFQAANILNGLSAPISVTEAAQAAAAADGGPVLLDVRTDAEHKVGAIPGALHIPLHELRSRLAEVPADREVISYCAVGQRGYLAERILRQQGIKSVRNLTGGFTSWNRVFPPPADVSGPPASSPTAAAQQNAGLLLRRGRGQ